MEEASPKGTHSWTRRPVWLSVVGLLAAPVRGRRRERAEGREVTSGWRGALGTACGRRGGGPRRGERGGSGGGDEAAEPRPEPTAERALVARRKGGRAEPAGRVATRLRGACHP